MAHLRREVHVEGLERQRRATTLNVEDARAEEREDEPDQRAHSEAHVVAQIVVETTTELDGTDDLVVKSSSVRIITAASFGTPVPVIPIATPMSARVPARRSRRHRSS